MSISITADNTMYLQVSGTGPYTWNYSTDGSAWSSVGASGLLDTFRSDPSGVTLSVSNANTSGSLKIDVGGSEMDVPAGESKSWALTDPGAGQQSETSVSVAGDDPTFKIKWNTGTAGVIDGEDTIYVKLTAVLEYKNGSTWNSLGFNYLIDLFEGTTPSRSITLSFENQTDDNDASIDVTVGNTTKTVAYGSTETFTVTSPTKGNMVDYTFRVSGFDPVSGINTLRVRWAN